MEYAIIFAVGMVVVFVFRKALRGARKAGRDGVLQEMDAQTNDYKRQVDAEMNQPRDEDSLLNKLDEGKF